MIQGPHKNLRVWTESMNFVSQLYEVTQLFPKEEIYGLTNQLRRAAVSIPSNIAEGYGRSSEADLLHFLYIALGSSNEIDTQLLIAYNIGYLTAEDYDILGSKNAVINKMLRSLIFKRTNG